MSISTDQPLTQVEIKYLQSIIQHQKEEREKALILTVLRSKFIELKYKLNKTKFHTHPQQLKLSTWMMIRTTPKVMGQAVHKIRASIGPV